MLELSERGSDVTAALSGFQVDAARGWLYEMNAVGLQVLSVETLEVVRGPVASVEGTLAGYNPHDDLLYFIDESGQLVIWPAANLTE